MDFAAQIKQAENEIKQIVNSEEYKELRKIFVWGKVDENIPESRREQGAQLLLLQERLQDLKDSIRRNEELWKSCNALNATSNAHLVKKADFTRKEYKRSTAVRDERLFLSDLASQAYRKFKFPTLYPESPTFGDYLSAAGFYKKENVQAYFDAKRKGSAEPNAIRDSLTEEIWLYCITLNSRVNPILHDHLPVYPDGKRYLVLENDMYFPKLVQEAMNLLYDEDVQLEIQGC
ncbi:hypothetical protein MIR68_007229 [Amoeboaphelidium protococcarum]|nr:hypothetical protein MIR68_007229 [Amoeboaphelidium protococcarum]